MQNKRNTIRNITNNVSPPDNFIRYAFVYLVLIASILCFYNFSNIKNNFSMDTFAYVGLITFLMFVVLFVVYPYMQNGKTNTVMVIFSLFLILTSFVISYFATKYTSNQLKTMSFILFVIAMVIISVGLAIFFYLYSSYLKNRPGVLGFIINFVFYIPCLIIDFLEYAQKDIVATSKTVYILFFIEVLFITAFFTYPMIYQKLLKSGVDILPGSVFLNKKQKIEFDAQKLVLPRENNDVRNTLSEFLFPNTGDPGMLSPTAEYKFSSNFSISMWIYLNVQTNSFTSAQDMNIFSYGAGKPKIVYSNSISNNAKTDVYKVFFSEDTNTSDPKQYFEISLPGQKWNNFVFNYKGNNVDLFINGVLEKTINLSSLGLALPVYLVTDTVTVGSNGLNGAICNISYTQDTMSKNQIITDYNILVKKNPPVRIQ